MHTAGDQVSIKLLGDFLALHNINYSISSLVMKVKQLVIVMHVWITPQNSDGYPMQQDYSC